MTTYTLTSTKFKGFVSFHFDKDGFLTGFDLSEAELDDMQKVWILQKLPRTIGKIKQVLGASRVAKLERKVNAISKVTFDMFWDRYDEKTRSSKKKSMQIWNGFSQAKRDRAYNFIEKYLWDIPHGVAKKYAETYLRSEIWEN